MSCVNSLSEQPPPVPLCLTGDGRFSRHIGYCSASAVAVISLSRVVVRQVPAVQGLRDGCPFPLPRLNAGRGTRNSSDRGGLAPFSPRRKWETAVGAWAAVLHAGGSCAASRQVSGGRWEAGSAWPACGEGPGRDACGIFIRGPSPSCAVVLRPAALSAGQPLPPGAGADKLAKASRPRERGGFVRAARWRERGRAGSVSGSSRPAGRPRVQPPWPSL